MNSVESNSENFKSMINGTKTSLMESLLRILIDLKACYLNPCYTKQTLYILH